MESYNEGLHWVTISSHISLLPEQMLILTFVLAESVHGGANGVNFYYGAPAPYAESIAPSHHSTYAHYYDDEEDGWDMPNFYNEVREI